MASFLLDHSLIETQESNYYRQYLDQSIHQRPVDLEHMLQHIPRAISSFAPLATLSALIEAVPGPWPVLELQRTHTALWRLLPEEAKAGRASASAQRLVDTSLQKCKASYTSLLDLYHPGASKIAVLDPETGRSAYHDKLATSIADFRLPLRSVPGQRKPVVAISLPNGPLLAMIVLATATYYTAAPVAHGSGVGKEQFKADVLQSKSNMVLACTADIERLGLRDSWLRKASISVLTADLNEDFTLTLRTLEGREVPSNTIAQPVPNHANDTGIMLFTSGTSGTKKLVPLGIHSIVCGVAMVAETWGLTESMRCLNQMPLNHVGGLIRNLFAPVFTGGSVICCSAFDANLFWDCVEDYAPTWYYASPSMHQVILETGSARPKSIAKSQIRLICNAAGGLLPSLAIQLRETFSTNTVDCIVLPSYGMTECMPISTPPLDYRLERTGTSGVSVGPEIGILDGRDRIQASIGEVGRIAVRGSPVFSGYLKDNDIIDTSCFTTDGWFDTGDMGYLDEAGFLYITGRSKEVINRGGELISPFEVEEAIMAAASDVESPIYGKVSKALALSVTHEVLQEVVGIAIVVPNGAKRPCLRSMQDSVKGLLSQVKVPVLIVYMEGGVPTNNNKVLRIKLADRLDLPTISDSTPPSGRYYEADCPPPNTPLSQQISSRPLKISHRDLHDACAELVPDHLEYHIKENGFYPELILTRQNSAADTPTEGLSQYLMRMLPALLDGYNVPFKISELDEPLPRGTFGDVDEVALETKLNSRNQLSGLSGDLSPYEATVCRIFADVLVLPANDLARDSDFFELGGDSMGAGRLLNALRKEYPLRLPINTLFMNPKVYQLAHVIREKLLNDHGKPQEQAIIREPVFLPGCEQTCSSTDPLLMVMQLLPLVLFIPARRAMTWTVFLYVLTETQNWATNQTIPGRLLDLVIAISVGGVVTRIVSPCVAIIFKWFVMGKYQEGLYPMWGSYHTRWWMTQKIVQCCGLGVFSLFNWTRVLYLRLMGVEIGSNVTIQRGVQMGEYDLITIGDDAVLERSKVRPFAAERNTSMYLGRIYIGANASIGLASIVAAGTTVPDNACIGPNSSSWEVDQAANEANRGLGASQVPNAHWTLEYLVGKPLHLLVRFCGAIPWLGALVALVIHEPSESKDQLRGVIDWFASPDRVSFHYLALAANLAFGPFFFFVAVLVLKRFIDLCSGGKIQPSLVDNRSAWTQFRMQWLRTVMTPPQFKKLTELFGTHYEATSIFARALGAKVGRQVYWPGTGPSVQDWDLLDIGNNVVFGSRSHMVTSDGTSSDHIKVGSGAMIADRVVLLPGVKIGEKSVMGSGSITRRNEYYAPETTWVGSKGGDAVCLINDSRTLVPATAVNTNDSSPIDSPGKLSLNYKRASLKQQGNDSSGFNSTSTTLAFGKTAPNSETSSMIDLHARPGNTTPLGDLEKSKDMDTAIPPLPDCRSNTELSKQYKQDQGNPPVETSSPFGRAFYEGKASYRVWGPFTIFLYSTIITVANGVYWNVGSVSAVQIISRFYRRHDHNVIAHFFLGQRWFRPMSLYIFVLGLIIGIAALQAIAVLGLIISAKWILMGRRMPGNYDWDKSSYCQRWQLFLKIETFRRRCYGGHGILGLLTGTHWLVLYFRALGANIGKDCSLFSGGLPSLMFTEPDLVTLGDRVAVDDASVVGHINTRGKFDLNPLSIGSRSVLRSGSRLLSGARMEDDSCLLEHTLVMAGDVVDAGTTSQGWPAEEFTASRMPTLEAKMHWSVKSV
ncbi:acyl CoA synthetase-like protein [Dothistroma septosporum NZE10]|uniref:Acyl CoA synthetase-like protein n=1 Tax=Dothistroma septosporum (strain NZE10 / CBS 128990) TaxID=675120 RepID=N1PTJ3_DOTSN|nr:acyl CoA synthetase-like protein [Dothistroma septosporum NZE10]